MRLIRTVLMAGLGLTTCLTAADARDFFVQPIKAGPVAGTAIAVITLQAKTTRKPSATTAPADPETPVSADTQTVGKWLKPYSTKTTDAVTDAPATPTPPVSPPTNPATNPATNGGTTPPAPGPTTPTSTPFNSIGAVFSSGQVQSGDRILLMAGYHGPLVIRAQKFTSAVVIAPMAGATAQVDSILVDNSTNVVIRGLKVWPSGTGVSNAPLIRTYSNTSDITFDQLDIRGDANAAGYMTWTKAQWLAKKRAGVMLQGARNSVINSRLTGIQHGVLAMGASALIEKNIIDGFSGDGMRVLGDNSIVRGNKIQNCFQIDANHADGIQSYSVGAGGKPGTGTVKNVTVSNNKFYEWTQSATNPLRCSLQGIGMFDGMYDGFLIENNVIIVSAGHGINLAGALNTIIRQNTVVAANGLAAKYPWIKVSYHKSGKPSNNVQIVNNLASNITSVTDPAKSIYVANNVIAGAASSEFVSWAAQNLALQATSKAVDAGDKTKTNAADIIGVARWKGAAPDAGAFESK